MKKIFGVDTYRDLFKQMLNKCSLNECTDCPGIGAMEKYIGDIMETNEIESVSFKQWVNQGSKFQSTYRNRKV